MPAIHEAMDFGEPTHIHDPLKLLAPVRTHNQDNLVDLVTLFETLDRISNNRLVADEAQQFIKSHPLAAASRYNNGGDHRGSVGVSARGSCQLQKGSVSASSGVKVKCLLDKRVEWISVLALALTLPSP